MAATEQPQEEEEGQGRKMNTFLHRVKRYLNVVITSEKKNTWNSFISFIITFFSGYVSQ